MKMKKRNLIVTSVVTGIACKITIDSKDYKEFNIKNERELVTFLDKAYSPNFTWEFS